MTLFTTPEHNYCSPRFELYILTNLCNTLPCYYPLHNDLIVILQIESRTLSKMQSLSSLFSHSPSLNRTCSSSSENNNCRFLLQDAFIKDDADELVSDNNQQQQQQHCHDDSEDEFEFGFASVLSPVPADQIFYKGQIRPFYPHFKTENKSVKSCIIPRAARLPLRKLLVEERELDSSASSCSSELEAGSYCIWDSNTAHASPELCKKSIRSPKLRDFLQKTKTTGNNSLAFLKFS